MHAQFKTFNGKKSVGSRDWKRVKTPVEYERLRQCLPEKLSSYLIEGCPGYNYVKRLTGRSFIVDEGLRKVSSVSGVRCTDVSRSGTT